MEVLQQIVTAAGVLALLAGTLLWLRRRGVVSVLPRRRSGARRLDSLERLPLGPQHTLHLVRLGQTALLVSSSPAGCALIQAMPLRELGPEPGEAQ
jgi:flagellar biogenesis protein FliO